MGCNTSSAAKSDDNKPEEKAPAPAAEEKEEKAAAGGGDAKPDAGGDAKADAGGDAGASAMSFPSGMKDCCSTNPESYKVVADIPGVARLIEMVVPPGGEDQPHEHPSHSLYFVTDCKLEIRDIDADGKMGEPHEAAPPAGAAPIFPPGAHQVKNINDKEARVIFVESYPDAGESAPAPTEFTSPFKACENCYKILAEDDKWVTGMLTMEPGAQDTLHNHKDHLIYVLEGDEITIFPGGNMEDPHPVPIHPYKGVAAPVKAGAIFNNHVMKNSGKTTAKMVFFELK
jgi:quercetin dioxygenase-like cupin family protein